MSCVSAFSVSLCLCGSSSSALLLLLPFSLPLSADEPDRAAIRKKMEQAMGPLPGADRKVPLDAKIISEEKLDGYVRKKVTFAVEKGDRVPAWLLVPDRQGRQAPRDALPASDHRHR